MTESELQDIQAQAMKIARLRMRIERGMKRLARPKIWLPKTPPTYRRKLYMKIANTVWRVLGQP